MALQIIGTSSELTTLGIIAVIILALLWHVLDKTFRKLMFQVCHTHVKIDRLAEMIPDGGPPPPPPPPRRHTAHASVKEGCHDEEPEPSLKEVLMRWHPSALSPGTARSCLKPADEGNAPPPPVEEMPAQGRVLLLFGCGTPDEPVRRLRDCRPRHLVVADDSPARLEAARARLAAEGLEAELVLVPADGIPLPLPDGSVDCIDCVGALQHGSPLEGRLSEIARVLAPGGRARIRVLQRDSVWWHGCTPSANGNGHRPSALREQDVVAAAREAGLALQPAGCETTPGERALLAQRRDPVLLESLAPESRRFLAEVEIDATGQVVHHGRPAGCELVFEVARPQAVVTPA